MWPISGLHCRGTIFQVYLTRLAITTLRHSLMTDDSAQLQSLVYFLTDYAHMSLFASDMYLCHCPSRENGESLEPTALHYLHWSCVD